MCLPKITTIDIRLKSSITSRPSKILSTTTNTTTIWIRRTLNRPTCKWSPVRSIRVRLAIALIQFWIRTPNCWNRSSIRLRLKRHASTWSRHSYRSACDASAVCFDGFTWPAIRGAFATEPDIVAELAAVRKKSSATVPTFRFNEQPRTPDAMWWIATRSNLSMSSKIT